MRDSDPNSNSNEELEEVTADDADWPAQSLASHHQQQGRRGRQAAVSGEVECLVCQLTASGNNFGVATCESCKTFFRRNAKRDASQIKCLHYNNCNVVKEYRRSCTACRLRKCFSVGMRKELILSKEKLRTRARPTFKKPRYRWCRVPASVDIDHLLSVLPAGGRVDSVDPPVRVKEEAEEAPSVPDDLLLRSKESGSSQRSSPDPSDADMSPACGQFESSHVYHSLHLCITNYQLPYDNRCAPSLLAKIFYLEDGFTTMDNPIRKMIRMIPELPLFDQMDKALLGRIVKLKVFGALQIISVLTYDIERNAWVFLLEQGLGMDEAVVHAREGMFGTFMSLTKQRLLDGRALYTSADVERMYQTLIGFYREMGRHFGEQRKLAAVVMLALYLLEEDIPLGLTEAEKSLMRDIQWHYMGYLDDIVSMSESDRHIVSYTSKRALLLLVQIRWLDTCYGDAAKALQISRLPPLMQELVTN